MSISLVNTIALPNDLAAHGRNHLAIYRNGVVSIYEKDEVNNTLNLQPTSYTIAGVVDMRLSADGSAVAVRTATRTFRLTGGTQTGYDVVGEFGISNTGTIVVLNIASSQVSVITTTTKNFTATLTTADKVSVGLNSFVVYNSTRGLSAPFTGVALTQTTFAQPVAYVAWVRESRYAYFNASGSVLFNNVTRVMSRVLYFHRNCGQHIVANDGTYDWAFVKDYPQSEPFRLRSNPRDISAVATPTALWMQLDSTALPIKDVVSGAPVLASADVTVPGGKITNTDNTVAVLDKIPPIYFGANEDFSMEGWFNFSSISTYAGSIISLDMLGIGGDGNRSYMLAIQETLNAYFLLTPNGNGAGYVNNPSTPTIALNTDNHLAVSRVSGTLKLYLNGVVIFTGPNAIAAFRSTEFLSIRRGAVGKRWNIRILRGASAYNGPFVPPVSFPPYTPTYYQSDVVSDIVLQACFRNNRNANELNGTAFTLASTAAIAYGRITTTPVNASRWSVPVAAFSAGDFTIECKVRVITLPTNTGGAYVMAQMGASAANSSWAITLGTDGALGFMYTQNGTTFSTMPLNRTLAINIDYHIVLERVDGVLTFYLDGLRAYFNPLVGALFTSTLPVSNATGVATSLGATQVTNIRIAKRAMYKGAVKASPTFPLIA